MNSLAPWALALASLTLVFAPEWSALAQGPAPSDGGVDAGQDAGEDGGADADAGAAAE